MPNQTDIAAGKDKGEWGEPFAPDVRTRLYLWMSGVFITSLLLANILGVKLFRFELFDGSLPVEHTVGMLPFPITFLLTDLLNEYYGKKAARRVTYVAFAMGALSFVLIYLGRAMPIREGIPGTADAASFEMIFGASALMYIASLVAFLCGSLLDIYLFGVFKRLTRGRLVWLRATGSTVVSQLFDSFIVTFMFFIVLQRITGGEAADAGFVAATALTGYILKFVIAVALTPFIYLGRWFIRTQFGMRPMPPETA
ncbi:MAG: queuosine precursor transporter [Phycisphaeraceae bacterium]|nr:queuosine precursor transporter [Phycisphaeraceae bacterium]